MRITIRLFAGIAQQLGMDQVDLEVDDNPQVADIKNAFVLCFPKVSAEVRRALVAVNLAYADDTTEVSPGDEVALIPPVGGGSPDMDLSSVPSCWISSAPLDTEAANQALIHPTCGGQVLFLGLVREWTNDRQTDHLSYEAYEEMALEQMKRIEADVKAQFPGVRTLMWHRVGILLPTEVAVIAGAAAPHRDAAFTVARLLIDRLKKEVPIWKREIYTSGDATWQPNP